MLRSYYIFLILGVLFPYSFAKRPMFYRKDYTYIERYDAFYKMDLDPNVDYWSSAFKVCDDEGAQLFYPEMQDEWKVAKELEENLVKQVNVREIFIGLHDEFKIGEFITIDGHSTASPLELNDSISTHNNCVGMNIDSGSFTSYKCVQKSLKPFVCKRVMDVDTIHCPATVDREYKYMKSLNKCFKVHKKQMDWNSAMRICYMEGGLLAVPETDSEISTIQEHLEINIKNDYYIGFRKMFNINEFYTIKGKVYKNQNFRDWYQPQNNEGSHCGVLHTDGKMERVNNVVIGIGPYDTILDKNNIILDNCEKEHDFICEIYLN